MREIEIIVPCGFESYQTVARVTALSRHGLVLNKCDATFKIESL